MIGMGRHLKAGKTEFMEFMTVESSGGQITMWILLGSPSKGPKAGVPFKLTSMNAQEVVFENPSNEFPSKIIYKRGGNGRMTARIEGVQAGKPAAQDFNFRRSR